MKIVKFCVRSIVCASLVASLSACIIAPPGGGGGGGGPHHFQP